MCTAHFCGFLGYPLDTLPVDTLPPGYPTSSLDTLHPVDRQTHVKILPYRNFVGGR